MHAGYSISKRIFNLIALTEKGAQIVIGHTRLEEIFESTSKPPNDINFELTIGKHAAI